MVERLQSKIQVTIQKWKWNPLQLMQWKWSWQPKAYVRVQGTDKRNQKWRFSPSKNNLGRYFK